MELFNSPLQTKKLYFKNRLILPPMATAMSEDDGSINEDIINYYNEKTANGKISLVIVEHAFVLNQGRARQKQISLERDCDIEGAKQLCDVIHKNGSLCCMQINHAGAAADPTASKMPVVAPSDVYNEKNKLNPTPMTKEQIDELIDAFAKAAVRVKAAGCDAVEIHSAHGYLLNQFYSPVTNKRTDEYGGNIDGRIKLHLQVIDAVRKAVGENFPVFLRLGAKDYGMKGSTEKDAAYAAKAFESAGIDVLDVTGGMSGYMNPKNNNPGYFADVGQAVKNAVSIPVILTGGITEKEQAEQLLNENICDLVGVGRAILKDSNWADKQINK